MKKKFYSALLASAILASCAPGDVAFDMEGNPSNDPFGELSQAIVSNATGGDPFALVTASYVRMYHSGSFSRVPYREGTSPATSSTVLGDAAVTTMTAETTLLDAAPTQQQGGIWAPTVKKIGTKYVIWYSAVPVAISPETDTTKPQKCLFRASSLVANTQFSPNNSRVCNGDFAIDPYIVYVSAESKAWLYAKVAGSGLSRKRLDPAQHGTQFLSGAQWEPGLLEPISGGWEDKDGPGGVNPCIENPAPVRLGATWFLFYSGNSWTTPNYAIGYGTCGNAATPSANCTKVTTSASHWNTANSTTNGPGGQSFFTYGGSDYMVYHGWANACGGDNDCTNDNTDRSIYFNKVVNTSGSPSRQAL